MRPLEGTSQRDGPFSCRRASSRRAGWHLRAPPGKSLYLRLVQEPASRRRAHALAAAAGPPGFRAPGRLARVGLFARLVDAGFNASLLLRGTVPGGTAAAAQIKYEAARAATRDTSITAGSSGGTAGSCSTTCTSTS